VRGLFLPTSRSSLRPATRGEARWADCSNLASRSSPSTNHARRATSRRLGPRAPRLSRSSRSSRRNLDRGSLSSRPASSTVVDLSASVRTLARGGTASCSSIRVQHEAVGPRFRQSGSRAASDSLPGRASCSRFLLLFCFSCIAGYTPTLTMRSLLVHFFAAASLVVVVGAQTCPDGCVSPSSSSLSCILLNRLLTSSTSLFTSTGVTTCCIAQNVVTGATCENSLASGQPRSTCYWTRQPDDTRFSFSIPQAIQQVVGVTLKGTHGEFLDNFSPDYSRQRGSIVNAFAFPGASSDPSLLAIVPTTARAHAEHLLVRSCRRPKLDRRAWLVVRQKRRRRRPSAVRVLVWYSRRRLGAWWRGERPLRKLRAGGGGRRRDGPHLRLGLRRRHRLLHGLARGRQPGLRHRWRRCRAVRWTGAALPLHVRARTLFLGPFLVSPDTRALRPQRELQLRQHVQSTHLLQRRGFNGDGSAAARLVTFTFACVRSLVPFSRCVRRC